MSLFSKRSAQSSAANADKKPAATFWDDPAPAHGKQQHSKVEQSEHAFGDPTMRIDASLELQTDLRSAPSSRDYLQQSINDSAANNAQPTSRARIEHAMKPRATVYRDGLHQLSTHRAARGEGVISAAERESLVEAAERKAYAGLMHILDLFAR